MKEQIKTYVINLKRATDRKRYMEHLLSSYDFLDVTFVEAVDGLSLSENDLVLKFDESLAYQRYGRKLNKGEIGCTLSHYKCYQKLLKSNDSYALILEDDITILRDLSILESIERHINAITPIILFLSGDYWFYCKKQITDTYSLATVYDAVGGYAYLINRAAAKLLLEKNATPGCLADSWYLTRRQGVKLKAVYPYVVDANIESFSSTIEQKYFGECRRKMPLKMRLNAYWNALVKKLILRFGGFVSKIRR